MDSPKDKPSSSQADDVAIPGFVLQRAEDGSLGACLSPGGQMPPEDLTTLLGRPFFGLSHLEGLKLLDLSQCPTESVSHITLSQKLLPFVLRDGIESVYVPDAWGEKVLGACQGFVVDALKKQTGGAIDVLGTSVRARDIVDLLPMLKKKVRTHVSSSVDDPFIEEACRVLNQITTLGQIPPRLAFAVMATAKHVRRFHKEYKRVELDKVHRQCPRPTAHESPGSPTPDEVCADNSATTSAAVLLPPRVFHRKTGKSQRCYVCKARYFPPSNLNAPTTPEASVVYPAMCPPCAQTNLDKRRQTAELHGKYAVVTGGRVKIGYHVVLKLLRDGCSVIATTRFPRDAARRFQQEEDFAQFKDRLKIYRMDLKDLNSIYDFAKYAQQTFPHLDILVNNAAQTIRRPNEYYRHLVSVETGPCHTLSSTTRDLLADPTQPGDSTERAISSTEKTGDDTSSMASPDVVSSSQSALSTSLKSVKGKKSLIRKRQLPDSCPKVSIVSAKLWRSSEGLVIPHQTPTPTSGSPTKDFPVGQLDEDGQQVDLRRKNSWELCLEQVSLSELLEVLTINAVAPFVLIQRLKPLFDSNPAPRKFIVNVSAMEGQFAKFYKGHQHPHTNMAKAALNMLTRTSSQAFQKTGLYMTAVDTGWVTDERPHHRAQREKCKGFILPLDSVDGAARVYDPIVSGLTDTQTEPHYGVFLKDYKVCSW